MTRTALVTGAGGGIGRAAALALAQDGFAVALAGRRREALEETAGLAGAATTLAIPADVTQPASVLALFATIATQWGRLDVLFNNAGGNVPSTNFGDLTDAQWDSVVAVNLTGVFRVARGAFRMMRDQTPQGVAASSTTGRSPPMRPAPRLRALHRDQARGERADQDDLAGRPPVQHRLRPGGRGQRRDGHDGPHGARRAAGERVHGG